MIFFSVEGFFGEGPPPAKTKAKVVSGGRNQPLDLGRLVGGGVGGHREGEDGVFVQRSAQEQVILDKLIPIDEATVQAHIIEERSEAIDQIHKGLVEINEMFTDLSKLIKDQDSEVAVICQNAGKGARQAGVCVCVKYSCCLYHLSAQMNRMLELKKLTIKYWRRIGYSKKLVLYRSMYLVFHVEQLATRGLVTGRHCFCCRLCYVAA